MRLSITHTKNNTYFYMIKSYRNDKGKNTSKIIECLGKLEDVKQKANGEDPVIWAKKYVEEKTKQENDNKGIYFEKLVEGEELDSVQKIYNLGHVFLRKIFEQLNLDFLCKEIKRKYNFEYELSDILEDLICTRILYPSSEYQIDALSDIGWRLVGENKSINLKDLNKYDSNNKNLYYKEVIIERTQTNKETKEKIKLKERMIVTFSPKYAIYQKNIRDAQILRAREIITKHPEKYSKLPQNNAKRFIKKENITDDGECANKYKLYFNDNLEKYEAQFDGLYALCVPENMEASIEDILQISKGRWKIEESFRIMKSEFKSRPVYLRLEERIKAHFVICYLSLLVYRILEKEQLKDKYTTEDIITTLKKMETNKIEGLGYKQLYQKSDVTTALNDIYDFNLDQKFISLKNMKKILKF